MNTLEEEYINSIKTNSLLLPKYNVVAVINKKSTVFDSLKNGPLLKLHMFFYLHLKEYGIYISSHDNLVQMIHPIIVFIALGTSGKIIQDLNLTSIDINNNDLINIEKLKITRFGNVIYDDNNKIIWNNTNDIIIRDVLNKIKRPPLLRHIIKKYCQKSNVFFSEILLKNNLQKYGLLSNPLYQFEDSHELILTGGYDDTLFGLLPIDIKLIIVKNIESTFIENNNLNVIISNFIGEMLHANILNNNILNLNNGEVPNIASIYQHIDNKKYSEQIKKESSDFNINDLNFENVGGVLNMFKSLMGVASNKLIESVENNNSESDSDY